MTSDDRLAPRREPGKWASIALAVFVHGVLLLALFFGIRWQARAPESVEVELYRAGTKAAPAPPPKVQPKPQPKTETKPKPEPKPEPIPKPPPKPDIALKEKQKPPPPKPQTKPQAKPEPKPKSEPKPKPEPKPERPAKHDEQQQKLLEEQLRHDTQQLAQQRVQREAEREMSILGEQREAAAASRARSGWEDKIRQKIRGNIILPPGVVGNPEAMFDVSLLPDGSLLNVTLRKSSGNSALDSAIERAIRKSDPLPKPDQGPAERELTLKFRPLEN